MQDWLDVIVPGSQILGILLVAYLLQRLLRRLVRKAAVRYQLPGQLVVPINGLIRWTIMAKRTAVVAGTAGRFCHRVVDGVHRVRHRGRRGVFAAWSVLSNLFCALLIFTARPFRIGTMWRFWTQPKSRAPKAAWWT